MPAETAHEFIYEAKERLYRVNSIANLLLNVEAAGLEDCDLQNIGHLISENLTQVQNDLDRANLMARNGKEA